MLVPITSDLAEDNNVALEQYIMSRAQLGAGMENYRCDCSGGNQTGMPTGFLGNSGTVVVDKDTSQAAGTFSYSNLLNLYSRFVGDPANAIWIYNRQLIPQIMTMAVMRPGGIFISRRAVWPTKPWGTLLGIAAMPWRSLPSGPGDSGDIALCDFQPGISPSPRAALQMAMSIHLYFDTNQLAYRWIFRMDAGKPKAQRAIHAGVWRLDQDAGVLLVLADRHA